ncbi:hypothetical protein GJ496_011059 [Pomphorhynchus laevis]|nr:hypothetical protein GJ496_011059 [Pomphorhynchus laevis]
MCVRKKAKKDRSKKRKSKESNESDKDVSRTEKSSIKSERLRSKERQDEKKIEMKEKEHVITATEDKTPILTKDQPNNIEKAKSHPSQTDTDKKHTDKKQQKKMINEDAYCFLDDYSRRQIIRTIQNRERQSLEKRPKRKYSCQELLR